jgi:alanine racemase
MLPATESPAPYLTAIVDLDALRHNLATVRRSVSAGTEIIACVKANAYGHGLPAVARCFEEQGVRWLSLGSPAGALALRRWGIACRILLFPTIARPDLGPLAEVGITIGIQSYREAEELVRVAREPVSVFLKVDGGLGRVGVPVSDAVAVARRILADLPSVTLEGVFTHLPLAGPEGLPWVQARLKEFGQAVTAIREHAKRPLLIQALASSGVVCGLETPETNAICPGQLLFGIEPGWTKDVTGTDSFGTRPALVKVQTAVGALHEIAEGSRFGVGGAKVASGRTRLGVLPIGYSNSILVQRPGQVAWLRGHPVPIVSVSLEHAVVDVTGLSDVEEGAPVCLVARDPGAGSSLNDFARLQGRSPLEVLVSLTDRAKYEYVEAGVAAR